MKNLRIIQLILLLAMTACVKETISPGDLPDAAPNAVSIKLVVPKTLPDAKANGRQTRSISTYAAEDGYGAENLVKEIVVLVFDSKADGTGLLQTKQEISIEHLPADQTKWLSDSTLIVGNMKSLDQPKNIYVVVNWQSATPAFDTSDFVIGTTSEVALRNKMTAIRGKIPTPSGAAPLTMQGNIKDYNFSNNEFKTEIGIVRATAKIRLNISIDDTFKAANPDITAWGETTSGGVHCRAVNIPNRTFVAGRTPSTSPSTADDADYRLIHYALDNAAVPQSTPHTWVDSVYVYESPVRGKTQASRDAATYVILHVPYQRNGVVQRANYYKVYINNVANTTDPYLVERNYLYDLNVIVKGFGMSEELAIPDAVTATLTVSDWLLAQFNARLEDSKEDVKVPVVIPPWDITYSEDRVTGGESAEEESPTTPGVGSTLPWEPNGDEIEL